MEPKTYHVTVNVNPVEWTPELRKQIFVNSVELTRSQVRDFLTTGRVVLTQEQSDAVLNIGGTRAG